MAAYRGYAGTIWQMGELRSDVWGGNTIESPFGIDLIENIYQFHCRSFWELGQLLRVYPLSQ
jgi:hypothetical protein